MLKLKTIKKAIQIPDQNASAEETLAFLLAKYNIKIEISDWTRYYKDDKLFRAVSSINNTLGHLDKICEYIYEDIKEYLQASRWPNFDIRALE